MVPPSAGVFRSHGPWNHQPLAMGKLADGIQRCRGRLLLIGMTGAVLSVPALNLWVLRSSASRVFNDEQALPPNDVGLVLGVSRSGNPHFATRTEAAALLYRQGKVKHLLLSGDNHVAGYDEPSDMKQAVLALGIPESAITLDYAGFRTLDSVVRAKQVFGQSKLTIITDEFHAY